MIAGMTAESKENGHKKRAPVKGEITDPQMMVLDELYKRGDKRVRKLTLKKLKEITGLSDDSRARGVLLTLSDKFTPWGRKKTGSGKEGKVVISWKYRPDEMTLIDYEYGNSVMPKIKRKWSPSHGLARCGFRIDPKDVVLRQKVINKMGVEKVVYEVIYGKNGKKSEK